MRLGTWIGIGLFTVAGLGCGGGSSKPASYSAVQDSIAHPTGTLAATNADMVAKAYQASRSAGTGPAGQRLDQKTSAVIASSACTVSGTISVDSVQMSGNAISEQFSYHSCCETADCCFNGPGSVYYETSGTGSLCESLQITGTCSGTPIAENFSYCSVGGTVSYLVEVGGESFAISATGTYSNGNGTLTITGKNGQFTCTYTNDTGTCTGSSGSFSF